MLSFTTRLVRMGPASWQVKVQACGGRSWEVDSRGGEQGYSRYMAVGRAAGGLSVHLPVNVLVGADGDNSRVRDLANISLMSRPSCPSLSLISRPFCPSDRLSDCNISHLSLLPC
jgi:hypothetical protein